MAETEAVDPNAGFSEEERLFEWRVEQFVNLVNRRGERVFSASEATRLVLDGADWHQAAKLVKTGCPHSVMRRIL